MIFFSKKKCTILKNLFKPCTLQNKWDQKEQRGKPKNVSVLGVGRMLTPNLDFLWPITNPLKKRLEIS